MFEIVIAGNQRQYQDYMRAYNIRPENARYVGGDGGYAARVLKSADKGVRAVFTGTYWERDDLAEIEEIIRSREIETATRPI